MRVIELRASNFKILKAVGIRPAGDVVRITGENGQGKSSVLDAIDVALRGAAAAPPQPIRTGEEESTIHLDLGEIRVKRTFKASKREGGDVTTALTITAADGTVMRNRPQEFLSGLIGALSLDPLAFARADQKHQFEVLKGFVPGFDFADNTKARKATFDRRTDVNRLHKTSLAAAAAVRLPAGPRPQAVDIASKVAELQAATKENSRIAVATADRDGKVAAASSKLDEAERLRSRAVSLEREAESLKAEAASIAISPKIDTDALAAEIKTANEVNQVVDLFRRRDEHATWTNAHKTEADTLTADIERLDKARADAIAAAKLPVEGMTLSVGDDGDGTVLLNGVPFVQASSAEKLVASTLIAMAANPKIRVLRIYDGPLLGAAAMETIAKMAAEHDYQVWIERVEDSSPAGIQIVEGEVAGG